MEDRYEIKEKIGQGGMGVVYRGYDSRMNRPVAIKRLIPDGDAENQKEATAQISKEASALASLQHPHIVTIFDVGSDEEGPYVVMELLAGKTLDELVEKAPFIWPDFREFALQSQEALIAAQELELVHRDIKPGNVMLTWLPSGKFQVKIVDFGLAALAPDPALQTLEGADSVLGSIYFMSPEHFERGRLDIRTDMYAMGCVYYYTLAGVYPFNGATGMEVMTAHLSHQVTPLRQLRPDLSPWVCDWVMWHMNRLPQDRPENARVALQNFLQNDKLNPQAPPPPSPDTKRIRLVIPGALDSAPSIPSQPDPAQLQFTQTAPQALLPPEGFKPSLHDTQPFATIAPTAPEPPHPPVPTSKLITAASSPSLTGTDSQPLIPAPSLVSPPADQAAPRTLSKRGKIIIGAVAGLIVALLATFLLQSRAKKLDALRFTEITTAAADDQTTAIPLTQDDLDLLLDFILTPLSNPQRQAAYRALLIATPSEGAEIDQTLTTFATLPDLAEPVRERLLRDVIRGREHPSALTPLIGFAKTSKNPRSSVLAIEAATAGATEDHFAEFIGIITTTDHSEIRSAAENAAAQIISKSSEKSRLAANIENTLNAARTLPVRLTMIRLLGHAGGEIASRNIRAALESGTTDERLAAVTAISTWPDASLLPELLGQLGGNADKITRDRAFDAALDILTGDARPADPAALADAWRSLAEGAATRAQQLLVIDALVELEKSDWSVEILQGFTSSETFEDRVTERARRALGTLGASN